MLKVHLFQNCPFIFLISVVYLNSVVNIHVSWYVPKTTASAVSVQRPLSVSYKYLSLSEWFIPVLNIDLLIMYSTLGTRKGHVSCSTYSDNAYTFV